MQVKNKYSFPCVKTLQDVQESVKDMKESVPHRCFLSAQHHCLLLPWQLHPSQPCIPLHTQDTGPSGLRLHSGHAMKGVRGAKTIMQYIQIYGY